MSIVINRGLMLSFVVSFNTHDFQRKFTSLELAGKDVLMWVQKVAVQTAKEILSRMEKRMLKRMLDLKGPRFLTSDKLAFRELRTYQICQLLRVFLVIHTHVLKDGCIHKLYFHMFRYRAYLASPLNDTQLLYIFLDTTS